MKLAIYFGLMIFALGVSLFLGHFLMKKNNKILVSFLIAFLSNVVILGLGSVWWFFTETDGLSQGLGVIYYCIAIGVISIIDLIVLSVAKRK